MNSLVQRVARWRVLAALSIAGCALSLAPPAAAQSASAQARTLFREARVLMDKGQHAEACPKLEESLRLDAGIGTQFNLAHCWEKIGRTASAWGLFMDAAAAAESAGQRKRAKAAADRAAELEPRLMRLVIEVATRTEALRVQRAGEEVAPAAWGSPMPLDPGVHHVEASAPGKRSWSQDVQLLVPGQTVTVVIPALEDAVAAPAEPSYEADADGTAAVGEDRGGSTRWRTAGTIAMAAVGVGGIVTGAIFGVRASDETDASRGLCTGGVAGNVCDRDRLQPGFDGGLREQEELEEHRDNAKSNALVSYVAFGVGGAALVGAAVLYFTTPDEARGSNESASLQVSPCLLPGWAGVSVSGGF